jgi:hypothetical protein
MIICELCPLGLSYRPQHDISIILLHLTGTYNFDFTWFCEEGERPERHEEK